MPCNDCSRTENCPPCPHEGEECQHPNKQYTGSLYDGPAGRKSFLYYNCSDCKKSLREEVKRCDHPDNDPCDRCLMPSSYYIKCGCGHVQGEHRTFMEGGCTNCRCKTFALPPEEPPLTLEEEEEAPEDEGCPHCPDGHQSPEGGSQPWSAWVTAVRDGDGQPMQITVARSAGAHVAESDAQWVRERLNAPREGRPASPCTGWSMQKPHEAHDFETPFDGPARCPGWPECPAPGSCPACSAPEEKEEAPPDELPPPEGPEYTPCVLCGHIEPEHDLQALRCVVTGCDCTRYRMKPDLGPPPQPDRRPPYAVAYSVQGHLYEVALPGDALVRAVDGALVIQHHLGPVAGIVSVLPVINKEG